MNNLNKHKNEFSSNLEYKIINVDSSQYGALANNNLLTMLPLNNIIQLKWKLNRQKDNSYIIKSSLNNLVLQTTYDTSWIVSLGQNNDSDSQRFYIDKFNDSTIGCYYRIKSKQSKLLLTCGLNATTQSYETGFFFTQRHTFTTKTYFLKLDKPLNNVTQRWIIST